MTSPKRRCNLNIRDKNINTDLYPKILSHAVISKRPLRLDLGVEARRPILEIRNVYLRLATSPALILSLIEHFEITSHL